MTAVAHAFLDRTPMLVLTAGIQRGHRGDVHAPGLRSVRAAGPDHEGEPLRSPSAAPRPRWIAPWRSWAAACRAPCIWTPRPGWRARRSTRRRRRSSGRAPVGLAEGRELDTLLGWLAAAERPLILAGLGILAHGAHAELAAFARRTGAAVITTYKAKGVIPEDDPMVIGAPGSRRSPTAPCSRRFTPRTGPVPGLRPGRDARLVDPAVGSAGRLGGDRVGPHRSRRAPGEARAGRRPAAGPWPARRAGGGPARGDVARRPAGRRARRGGAALRPPDGRWGPHAVVDTCRRVFPRDTIATVDTGSHRILLSQVWDAYEPGGLLQSTGLATMGYGLPAAIGAKLARPERPVVCFTGDGGLEMTIGELATVRDLGQPLVIVCFADRSLALIELKQRRLGLPNVGVDFAATDLVEVARAYGGHGVRVGAGTPSRRRAATRSAATGSR